MDFLVRIKFHRTGRERHKCFRSPLERARWLNSRNIDIEDVTVWTAETEDDDPYSLPLGIAPEWFNPDNNIQPGENYE